MQESMNLAQSGDTAGAYSNMMGIFASNPTLMQNKAALPFLEIGLKGIDESSKSFLDSERLRVQESRYGSQYGSEPQQSGAEAAEQAIMGAEEQVDFGQVDAMANLPVMETVLTPAERAAKLGAEDQRFKMQQPAMTGPTKEAAAAQKDFDKLPTYKQASVANVAGFNALPAQQKFQAVNEAVAFDPGASKYEEAKIDLGEYGIDIGSIGVPKANEQVRIKMTASGTNNDPTVRKTFSQDFIKVGEEQYNDNKEFISKLRDSSSKLSRERPAADLPTFKEIFQQNGGILNATLAPSQSEDELEIKKYPFIVIPRQGATPIPITEKQYEMIQTIQIVPAIADSTGLNLSASKNIQKPSDKTQYTEGTIVEQGGKRYKFTNGKWVDIQ
jgi:hypothetical protein